MRSRLVSASLCALVASPTVLLCGLVAASAASRPAATPPADLLIDRVAVVDVRTGRVLPGREVVIAGGRIVSVGPAGSVPATGNTRRVDGAGRYLVPGFNDMHAHNLNTASPETSLPVMLSYGITGFRQMAGAPQLLAARAAARPLLPVDSPALLAMPGTILAGPAFAQPDAVRAEVGRQQAEGADFIKIIDLPPAAFDAAADAATAAGLPFAGHLPLTVDARDAMRRGMASIEHLGPGIALLLNCSRDEPAIRAALAHAPPPAGADFDADPAVVRRMLANPILATPPQGYALIRRVLSTYDDAKCRMFARDVAASATWMVPTAARLEAMELGDTPALRDNPDLRYVPAASRALWADVGREFDARLTPDQRQTMADLFAAQMRLLRLFDEAGVKLLAGTDFGGGSLVPGSSLHHEFDLLAANGVAPARVLRMTTIDAARFLHREATMGTVEPGRAANLVLLDGDPTASVAALHRVAGVVRAGRYYDGAALQALRARAAASLAER